MKRFLLSACLAFGLSQAATLPYQGLATDAKGNPKSDAAYQVDFALYSSATGVTPLWRESQTLSTRKGLFSTLLGSETLIPDSLFKGTALYLGVRFDGGSEGGRVLLGTTPWASAARKSVTSAFADSAGKVAGLSDSVAALRSTLASHTDSTKVLRDTVASLKSTLASQATTIAGLNTTVGSQANSLTSLLSLLNPTVSWQTGIAYGTLVDIRDGQVYRTVTIGTQTWMAQNLNFAKSSGSAGVDTGKCYSNSADSCAKYGRLYTWSQSLGLNGTCDMTSCATLVAAKQRGLCPVGWHVPSDAEWSKLTDTTLVAATAGTLLKSTSGWTSNTGSDISGFRALPGGYVDGSSFHDVGYYGYWWSATEIAASSAWSRYMHYGNALVYRLDSGKTFGFSLRCVKD